jgi:uncharacterized protein YjeT (DUF2065 family)
MKDLLCVLGLVILLEGLPYFLSPAGMKRLMEAIPRIPDRSLRIWGLVAMVFGLLLVYIGRQ